MRVEKRKKVNLLEGCVMADDEKIKEEAAVDQSFNDDELQDIMSEIENLEKEFVEDEAPEETVAKEVVEDVVVAESEPVVEENVVPISKQASSPSHEGGNVDFNGSGSMNFNLNFNVGGEVCSVDINDGLEVKVSGVSFSVKDDGCEILLDNGMKFSVPFGSSEVSKKAS